MRLARGYTTIEVAAALAILGVGAAGAISLQKVAVLGNVEARVLDGARQVGATWSSHLELDALVWNDPRGAPDIADTRFLSASIPRGTFDPLGPADWILAPEIPGFGGPVADIHGVDVPSLDPPERGIFCTHLRLARVLGAKELGAGSSRKTAVLADIRVVWRRDLAPMMECRTTPPALVEESGEIYSLHRLPPILILQKEAPF